MRLGWAIAGLVACSGGDDAPPVEPGTCDGGGEQWLEIGDGGRDAFVAADDGDGVSLRDRSGTASAYLELQTSGLDTTEPMTVVVRLSVGGGPSTDSLGSLTFSCDDAEGLGWTGVFATLPPEAEVGGTLTVRVTATDAAGTAVTNERALVLED